MKKDEEITKLKKLARKAHDARQRRQYDNAKIHHANLLKDLLDVNPRLHLEFLPPCSPTAPESMTV